MRAIDFAAARRLVSLVMQLLLLVARRLYLGNPVARRRMDARAMGEC